MALNKDIKKISARLDRLEVEVGAWSKVISRMAAWFSRRRPANAISRHLSGPEACDLRAQMRAHGVTEDDESRNERGQYARHR